MGNQQWCWWEEGEKKQTVRWERLEFSESTSVTQQKDESLFSYCTEARFCQEEKRKHKWNVGNINTKTAPDKTLLWSVSKSELTIWGWTKLKDKSKCFKWIKTYFDPIMRLIVIKKMFLFFSFSLIYQFVLSYKYDHIFSKNQYRGSFLPIEKKYGLFTHLHLWSIGNLSTLDHSGFTPDTKQRSAKRQGQKKKIWHIWKKISRIFNMVSWFYEKYFSIKWFELDKKQFIFKNCSTQFHTWKKMLLKKIVK